MLENPKNYEKMPIGKSGIYEKDGHFFASIDGKNSVPVDAWLAKNIDTALRVQEKINVALTVTPLPRFLRLVAMLNCRKSVAAVSGSPLRPLLRTKGRHDQNLSTSERLRAKAEIDGVPELMADTARIIDSGNIPVLGSYENMHITEYLDDQSEEFPLVVHTFFIPKRYTSEILSTFAAENGLSIDNVAKLVRNHSFIVLGKANTGEYICFHKPGPSIHDPFKLQNLNAVTEYTLSGNAGRLCLSVIGPLVLKKAQEGSSENTVK